METKEKLIIIIQSLDNELDINYIYNFVTKLLELISKNM